MAKSRMKNKIKVCIDRILPADLRRQADARVVEENPDNAVQMPSAIQEGTVQAPSFVSVPIGNRWRNGRTLRVCFLDGSPTVHARVEPYAHQWSSYANIKFEFGHDADAEIRISFEQEGSWSYIGTDALVIPNHEPTMNFGWLKESTPLQEYARVVGHEFGHALGNIHEHQNPASSIPWDEDAVYRYYMGPPNNWSKAEIDRYVFQRYTADITSYSEFDIQSIMLYPIPNELTIGDFVVGWNNYLSEMDKAFISTIYPFL